MIEQPGTAAAEKRPAKRPMLPRERLAYSAMTARAPFKIPDGALAAGPKAQ
ncbi:MAG: hypothetical protein ABSA90_14195 [Xanthobacteraceae bacterium]|jgi:hypothetical protein